MALGDPAFGPSYDRAVALNGELLEALEACVKGLDFVYDHSLFLHRESGARAALAAARSLIERIHADGEDQEDS